MCYTTGKGNKWILGAVVQQDQYPIRFRDKTQMAFSGDMVTEDELVKETDCPVTGTTVHCPRCSSRIQCPVYALKTVSERHSGRYLMNFL